MPTISFIVFMLIGYFVSNEVNVNSKTREWLWSLLLPGGLLVVTVLIFGGDTWYTKGQATAQCLVATIATMILMKVRLSKKIKHPKTKKILSRVISMLSI